MVSAYASQTDCKAQERVKLMEEMDEKKTQRYMKLKSYEFEKTTLTTAGLTQT